MITASGSIRLTAEAIPGAEVLDRAVDQLGREVIAVVQRSLPDPAGEPVAPLLLHDPEEVGLRAPLYVPSRLQLHRQPSRVGLHAPSAPAGASGAPALDNHVPDLGRRPAAEPGLAVEDQPAADSGAPPDAEDRVELLRRPELELALNGDLDVVADRDRDAQLVAEVLPEREGAVPAGQVAGVGDDAGLLVGVARRADSGPSEVPSSQARLRRRLAQGRCDLLRDVLGPAGRRCRAPGLAEDLVLGVDDDRLDLGAAQVDAPAGRLRGAGAHAQTIRRRPVATD